MNRRTKERRAAAGALITLLAVGLAACGNLTAGGLGEATVVMSGDAPEEGATPQAAVTAAPGPATSPAMTSSGATSPISASSSSGPLPSDPDDNDPEGELEARLRVYLVTDEGQSELVSDGEVDVRVDLLGEQEPVIASRSVTARSYAGLRLVFSRIEVEVDAGLIIGGVEVTGLIEVELEHTTLTVEKPLALDAPDGGRAEVVVDLNSDSWLLAVDPVAHTVDAQTFADLVTVTVR